ncbi:Acetate kinase (Acetokinase) [Legionella gratiana]|uniref:Acetate kinase n=1 Tax=Legionella gratiana TaxID=45066 RepID=A0A378JCJ4_9GAMM|nr:acetate/propionate family kinase [Legionella gratiana]KTD09181.1 Acetate kinase (Acetokinase) [Legionella gratiana]STX45604.1 Acetate kinase (Acetokinase) [Legionella gratiana]
MNKLILVINSGSSSIKFSLFASENQHLDLFYHGQIQDLYESPKIDIFNASQVRVLNQSITSQGHEAGLKILFNWLDDLSPSIKLGAVGHRVVHGGTFFPHPMLITDDVIKKIASLIPLAPLHQPHNLEAITIINHLYPNLAQIACFDTTFHRTQQRLATLFALPRSLSDEGVLRYGFHGLSYEYIASVITESLGEIGSKRVIMAHLGNGASMCAMYQGKSVATSMGFTALDGLMMGTRCGRIDPGVLLYLLEQKKYSAEQVGHLLYNESGLLGVSGLSNNVRELLEHLEDGRVLEAINLFCYRAALEAGSLLVALGGCDVLIFTAGIGEHAPLIRKKISDHLSWLGIKINDEANNNNATIISEKDSTILVSVIPTNEELMIAQHVQAQLKI